MKIDQLNEIIERIKRISELNKELYTLTDDNDFYGDFKICEGPYRVATPQVHVYRGLDLIAETLYVTDIESLPFDGTYNVLKRQFTYDGITFFQIYTQKEADTLRTVEEANNAN